MANRKPEKEMALRQMGIGSGFIQWWGLV